MATKVLPEVAKAGGSFLTELGEGGGKILEDSPTNLAVKGTADFGNTLIGKGAVIAERGIEKIPVIGRPFKFVRDEANTFAKWVGKKYDAAVKDPKGVDAAAKAAQTSPLTPEGKKALAEQVKAVLEGGEVVNFKNLDIGENRGTLDVNEQAKIRRRMAIQRNYLDANSPFVKNRIASTVKGQLTVDKQPLTSMKDYISHIDETGQLPDMEEVKSHIIHRKAFKEPGIKWDPVAAGKTKAFGLNPSYQKALTEGAIRVNEPDVLENFYRDRLHTIANSKIPNVKKLNLIEGYLDGTKKLTGNITKDEIKLMFQDALMDEQAQEDLHWYKQLGSDSGTLQEQFMTQKLTGEEEGEISKEVEKARAAKTAKIEKELDVELEKPLEASKEQLKAEESLEKMLKNPKGKEVETPEQELSRLLKKRLPENLPEEGFTESESGRISTGTPRSSRRLTGESSSRGFVESGDFKTDSDMEKMFQFSSESESFSGEPGSSTDFDLGKVKNINKFEDFVEYFGGEEKLKGVLYSGLGIVGSSALGAVVESFISNLKKATPEELNKVKDKLVGAKEIKDVMNQLKKEFEDTRGTWNRGPAGINKDKLKERMRQLEGQMQEQSTRFAEQKKDVINTINVINGRVRTSATETRRRQFQEQLTKKESEKFLNKVDEDDGGEGSPDDPLKINISVNNNVQSPGSGIVTQQAQGNNKYIKTKKPIRYIK